MKVTYADIIRTVNEILAAAYPTITRYGNDTIDKATPPYFFVELLPLGIYRETKMIRNKRATVYINYIQRVPDQVDQLEKVETLMNALGMKLTIVHTIPASEPNGTPTTESRRLLVLDYSHRFTGGKMNNLQISFNLDWWEDMQEAPTEDLMLTLHTNIEEGD